MFICLLNLSEWKIFLKIYLQFSVCTTQRFIDADSDDDSEESVDVCLFNCFLYCSFE
jgi:hypothetical protein